MIDITITNGKEKKNDTEERGDKYK